MIDFKKFINLHAEKKCPPGYKFDQKLGVCVPKGERGYYPFYGIGSRNGDTSSNQRQVITAMVMATVMATVMVVTVMVETVVANNEI